MKIKNVVLFDLNFIEAIVYFSKLQLPVKISYPIQKCLKIFQSEEVISKASKDELIKKYGKLIFNDSGEQGWDVNQSSAENKDKFFSELSDLYNLEFEIPIENKLVVKIKDIEDQKISSTHLNVLSILIDFQE